MDENRIVLIRGNGSEWYEQAIFILKSPTAAKNKNLVQEAEKIINNYMTSGGAGILTNKLELYKKSVHERAARNSSAQSNPQKVAAAAPNIVRTVHAAGKFDYTTLFISVCLIVCSILFGFIMHRILSP